MAKKPRKTGKNASDTKSRTVPWSVVICSAVLLLVIVFAFIPEETITNAFKSKKQKQYEENLANAGKSGIVVEDTDSSGRVRPSSVYGGADYESAMQEYWAQNKLEGYESIYTYLQHNSPAERCGEYVHKPLGSDVKEETVSAEDVEDFDIRLFSQNDRLKFVKDLEVIGVSEDYYVICRLIDTNYIFILDCSEMYFGDEETLVEFGMRLSSGVDTAYVDVDKSDGFTFIFVGREDKDAESGESDRGGKNYSIFSDAFKYVSTCESQYKTVSGTRESLYADMRPKENVQGFSSVLGDDLHNAFATSADVNNSSYYSFSGLGYVGESEEYDVQIFRYDDDTYIYAKGDVPERGQEAESLSATGQGMEVCHINDYVFILVSGGVY